MFETALIESKRQQATGNRWLSVPMSVFLHFVIGGTVIAASMWYIEDIPEPPIPVTFAICLTRWSVRVGRDYCPIGACAKKSCTSRSSRVRGSGGSESRNTRP